MAVQAVRGLDIKIYIVENETKTMLAGQRSCSLSMSANEIDISNKTTSATGFGDFLAGTKEAEISCDGIMVVDDVAQGKLFQAFMAGSDLKVEMRNGSQAGTDATVKWSATVVCTALDLTADYDGVYEYSATFKVKGDLTKDV